MSKFSSKGSLICVFCNIAVVHYMDAIMDLLVVHKYIR